MAERPAINASLALTDWLVVEETLPVPELIQSWDLGAGESSVLTWELIAFWSVERDRRPKASLPDGCDRRIPTRRNLQPLS